MLLATCLRSVLRALGEFSSWFRYLFVHGPINEVEIEAARAYSWTLLLIVIASKRIMREHLGQVHSVHRNHWWAFLVLVTDHELVYLICWCLSLLLLSLVIYPGRIQDISLPFLIVFQSVEFMNLLVIIVVAELSFSFLSSEHFLHTSNTTWHQRLLCRTLSLTILFVLVSSENHSFIASRVVAEFAIAWTIVDFQTTLFWSLLCFFNIYIFASIDRLLSKCCRRGVERRIILAWICCFVARCIRHLLWLCLKGL